MFHYLFTNDLRISNLESTLKKTGECFITNTVPSASDNKSENNNMMTLGFYFNLTENSRCAVACSEGKVREVVLNFIKKFQFPNVRTSESYKLSLEDGIKIAPLRLIVQILYLLNLKNQDNEAYLTRGEIENFIFYNSAAAKVERVDIEGLIDQILEYRKTGVYPSSVETDESQRQWKHQDRQIREMVKVLTWSGCVVETSEDTIEIHQDKLSVQNKSDLLDILTYYDYWNPPETDDFNELKKSYQEYMDVEYDLIEDISKNDEILEDRLKGGTNIILYGVPGAGKSWTIKNEYCDDESRMERLVFHPDYTYSDFVGQILPVISDDGTVTYEFTPGPFTKIVRKAYLNPDKMYYLIIEEVNRGNAPAIFGDIFQLLDRDEDGNSEYDITNADIARIVYMNESHKVSIPSNLCILCTMNTSDQNVFTLDTAFQRRWNMRLIRNKFRNEESEMRFANTKILDTDVTWEKFFTEMNNFILGKNIRMTSSEDKRLGTHFVTEDDLKMGDGDIKHIRRFPEKVLKYLWDDAFKFTKEDVFDLDKIKSLEDAIDLFMSSEGNARFLMFKENIYNSLVSGESD